MTKNLAKRLDGKVCIITGSANGIGFATAQKFCDEGGISIICDMNADQVKVATEQLKSTGGNAEGYVMNVTDRKNIDQVVAAVIVGQVAQTASMVSGSAVSYRRRK